jgi:hypothetical protein
MGVSALVRVAHFNEYLKKHEFARYDDVVIVEGDGLEIHDFYSHKILMHISSHSKNETNNRSIGYVIGLEMILSTLSSLDTLQIVSHV